MSIQRFDFTVGSNDNKTILQEVKRNFGEDAIIESITLISPKTPTNNPEYKVIVSIDSNDYQKHLDSLGQQNLSQEYEYRQDDIVEINYSNNKSLQDKFFAYDNKAKKTINQPPMINQISKQQNQQAIKSNYDKVNDKISSIKNTISNKYIEGISAKTIYEMQKELKQLSDKMSTLASIQWEEKSSLRGDLAIPPEFASIYKKAKQSGMLKEHLDHIMKVTLEKLPSSMRLQQATIERYFHLLLRGMLPCRVDENSIKEQKIMMLVGPTGVGKTTTLAKLAYRYAHIKKLKTGIITLDTYRLGAVEQLRQYANMMRLPMIDVLEASDFDRALRSLSTCEVVLVDTIGGSQYDYKKLEKIYNITSTTPAKLDISLVLNAGSKYEDLLETYKAFSFLNLDTMIITKFDETKLFGNVFSLVCETSKPVSFFSVGQEVPDDLMEADAKFLVDCILDGFYKVKG